MISPASAKIPWRGVVDAYLRSTRLAPMAFASAITSLFTAVSRSAWTMSTMWKSKVIPTAVPWTTATASPPAVATSLDETVAVSTLVHATMLLATSTAKRAFFMCVDPSAWKRRRGVVAERNGKSSIPQKDAVSNRRAACYRSQLHASLVPARRSASASRRPARCHPPQHLRRVLAVLSGRHRSTGRARLQPRYRRDPRHTRDGALPAGAASRRGHVVALFHPAAAARRVRHARRRHSHSRPDPHSERVGGH